MLMDMLNAWLSLASEGANGCAACAVVAAFFALVPVTIAGTVWELFR
jgi:hypothetical protein